MLRRYLPLTPLLFILSLLFFSSCSSSSGNNHGEGGNAEGEENGSSTPPAVTVIAPEWKDYGKDTTAFAQIVYSRPDVDTLIGNISAAAQTIAEGTAPFEDQLASITDIEEAYSEFLTMYSYSNIMISKNSADTYYTAEHEYLSTAYPNVVDSVEEMMVAAANSEHAERFEEEYFGEGFIEKYREGEYTDAIVELMEKEAELEAEYSSLSTANITITYGNVTDTYDNVVAGLKNELGENTEAYAAALCECDLLYNEALSERSQAIYINLLKIRRAIAEQYGYESYATYAYEHLYHDYSPYDMEEFTADVAEYVVPVYAEMSRSAFYKYFRSHEEPEINVTVMINTLYDVYRGMNEDISDIYAYMLGRGLYDVTMDSHNRMHGAFTTYLYSYQAPYVFATVYGKASDYMTFSHEFGHFVDSFLNDNEESSLDLMEISSQGLEWLTLSRLDGVLDDDSCKYLYYSQMENALLTLIFQSFYARFEHMAYKLSVEEITPEGLDAIVEEAASDMYLNADELSDVLIEHLMLYPFYVQSYCPSLVVSLEIFFMEEEEYGKGLAAYEALVTREERKTFEEYIAEAGFESPFREDGLKELADRIYFAINGTHFYKEFADKDNAA